MSDAGRPRALAALALAAVLAVPLSAQERMLAMGDSITKGVAFDEQCTSGIPDDCGYPRRLEQQMASRGRLVEVVNLGVGGEDTTEGLSRVDQVLALGGTVLLLMEGTNDINRGIPPTTTRRNLNEMALRAEARGYQVVHATVIPRPPWAKNDPDNVTTAEQAGQIRSMAYNRARRLADPFERFGSEPSPFTRLYSHFADDFVGHPNAAGFELLARLFAEVLSNEDLTPPVRGEISPLDRAAGVAPESQIRVELIDFGTGIDAAQTRLTVGDSPVPVTMSIEPRRIVLLHQPANPLRAVVHVGVESRDLATPPNTVDRELASFVIAGTTFLTGDLDRSGRVDGADLVAFARRFGARRNDARYLAAADFNNDGLTDGVDLAALAANFGSSSF